MRELDKRLMAAVRLLDLEGSRRLLEAGGDPNAVDVEGVTLLHWTVRGNWPSVNAGIALARLLLEHGANLNAADRSGQTPLHWAVRSAASQGGRAVVWALLDLGADLGAVDSVGRTPLHFACVGRSSDAGLVRLLLAAGADPNARNARGTVPLQGCARLFPPVAASQVLLDAGASANLVKGEVLTAESCRQDWRDLRKELALAAAQLIGEFNGYNDSGYFDGDGVRMCRLDDATSPLPLTGDAQRRRYARILERVGYDLLEAAWEGWELDEGSRCKLTVRAADPPIRLVVHDRAVDYRLLDAWFAHDGVVVGKADGCLPSCQARRGPGCRAGAMRTAGDGCRQGYIIDLERITYD